MRWILILMFLINCYSSNAQEHFVKSIDINDEPQLGSQLITDGNYYYISSILTCPEKKQCSGILKCNIDGEILELAPIDTFSNNLDGMLWFENNILLNGEYNMGRSLGFTSFKIESENLSKIDETTIQSTTLTDFNYIANNALIYDKKLIVSGSSFATVSSEQVGQLFVLNPNDFHIDTSFRMEFSTFSTRISNMHKTSFNELVLFLSITEKGSVTDSVQIIRLDTLFNKTFQWSLPIKDRGHIPRGCVTSDDNMIITVPGGFLGNTEEIWSLDTNGTTNWIYEWPSDLGTTNVLRIEEAKNGDLFVMGQRWNPAVLDDKRNVAIVMRLDKYGHELWRRYFKLADQNTLLSNSVSDLVELDNGDLILTGQTRRIIYDPSIGMERPDQDIFWARIGGDGCINGDCEEEYIVTSTEEVEIEKESWARIYPNPSTSHELNISLSKSAKVELMGISGKIYQTMMLEKGHNNIEIENINEAVFLIKCTDEKGHISIFKSVKI